MLLLFPTTAVRVIILILALAAPMLFIFLQEAVLQIAEVLNPEVLAQQLVGLQMVEVTEVVAIILQVGAQAGIVVTEDLPLVRVMDRLVLVVVGVVVMVLIPVIHLPEVLRLHGQVPEAGLEF
jgi:hypothetical protein